MTEAQKKAAQACVQIFETSKLGTIAAYSVVTLLKGDTGGLTYGKHQTTINSGNLYLMLLSYCKNPSAKYAADLSPYLDDLKNKSAALGYNNIFKGILKTAGTDPTMQKTQDEFFERVYWNPAVSTANALGITEPLGVAIVYDSFIHGSWKAMKDRTVKSFGLPTEATQRKWIAAYNRTRRTWLANHSNSLLRKTIYRQDSFQALMDAGNWSLDLPFTVRGVKVTAEALGVVTTETPEVEEVTAEDKLDRLLFYNKKAMLFGEDVVELQTALVARGFVIGVIDGKFGQRTETAVEAFQKLNGLFVDGLVGTATKTKLGIL
jgi:chitosanase